MITLLSRNDGQIAQRGEQTIATLADTTNFLKRFKMEAAKSGIDFIPRRPNMDTLALLGITIADAETTMLSLSATDYVSGPEGDHDGSVGEIWVFGTRIDRVDVYIKLKLGTGRAACISFHEARYQLNYPHR